MRYNVGMYKKCYTLDDYIITEDGKVIAKRNGKALKGQPNDKGYLRIAIGKKRMFIHRLVAEKYVPNPENKPQVNHINGIKTDNRACNLEWVTNQENRDHARKNGLIVTGELVGGAKLNADKVRYIRENPDGMTVTELAAMFGVQRATIRAAATYRTWKTVEKVC